MCVCACVCMGEGESCVGCREVVEAVGRRRWSGGGGGRVAEEGRWSAATGGRRRRWRVGGVRGNVGREPPTERYAGVVRDDSSAVGRGRKTWPFYVRSPVLFSLLRRCLRGRCAVLRLVRLTVRTFIGRAADLFQNATQVGSVDEARLVRVEEVEDPLQSPPLLIGVLHVRHCNASGWKPNL